VTDGSRQPIEPHHDENVASGELREQSGQHRASARSTGAVLLIDSITACGTELAHLGIMKLIVG